MDRLRVWFLAAAVYNVVWGTVVVLFPRDLFRLAGVPPTNYPALFQCIGMLVLAYAPAYWLVWRDPARFGPFVWSGLIGKVLGPVGFVVAALRGDLPWSFFWLIALNDLPWIPAFVVFAARMRRD